MNRQQWPVGILVAVSAIVSWLAVNLLPAGTVRAALAIPLVLVLPGYAVLLMMSPRHVKGLEGICYVVGLSMSIGIATGYFLNHFGALNASGWAQALTTICLAAAGASSLKQNEPTIFVLPHSAGLLVGARPLLRQPFGRRFALLAASLAMTGTAVSVASRGAESLREFKYTELWIAPSQAARKDEFQLGIRNMEGHPARYGLEVTADGKLISKWDAIDLGDGSTWGEISSAFLGLKKKTRVEARLFRLDDPSRLYRQAWLNLPTQ